MAHARLTQMLWNLLSCDGSQNFVHTRLADVDQHVSVRKPFHSSLERWLGRWVRNAVDQRFASKVVFQNLSFSNRYDTVIVEAKPSAIS